MIKIDTDFQGSYIEGAIIIGGEMKLNNPIFIKNHVYGNNNEPAISVVGSHKINECRFYGVKNIAMLTWFVQKAISFYFMLEKLKLTSFRMRNLKVREVLEDEQ